MSKPIGYNALEAKYSMKYMYHLYCFESVNPIPRILLTFKRSKRQNSRVFMHAEFVRMYPNN